MGAGAGLLGGLGSVLGAAAMGKAVLNPVSVVHVALTLDVRRKSARPSRFLSPTPHPRPRILTPREKERKEN